MPSRPARPLHLLPFLALLILPVQAQAQATDACAAQVTQLAERYGLTPAVPAGLGEEDPEISASDLQESGGVIAPPVVGDSPVIEPEVLPEMPTAPTIMGDATEQPDEQDSSMDRAAFAAQAESMLGAAMAAAETGDVATCGARLEEARAMLATPMPGTVLPEGGNPGQ